MFLLSVVPQLSTLLLQLLLCLHSLRRLLECLRVSVFSNGVLHLAQYIFGLCYYVVLGLTVLCMDRMGKGQSKRFTSSWSVCCFGSEVWTCVILFLGTGNLPSQLEWFHLAGIVLFIGASVLQHRSLVLLAKLRTGQSGELLMCVFVFAGLCYTFMLKNRNHIRWCILVLFHITVVERLMSTMIVGKETTHDSGRNGPICFTLFFFCHVSGKVESLAHRVPVGGWFELVSCPHYFAEFLIYISLGLVFGGLSLTWCLVVLYVFFNQALAAQLCHELYITRFKSYPKHRKAFIPFVLWKDCVCPLWRKKDKKHIRNTWGCEVYALAVMRILTKRSLKRDYCDVNNTSKGKAAMVNWPIPCCCADKYNFILCYLNKIL